jgi:hypothetical protein
MSDLVAAMVASMLVVIALVALVIVLGSIPWPGSRATPPPTKPEPKAPAPEPPIAGVAPPPAPVEPKVPGSTITTNHPKVIRRPTGNSDLDHVLDCARVDEERVRDAGGTPAPAAREGWKILDAYVGDRASIWRAAEWFGTALDGDQKYALAWAGLAECAIRACYDHGEVYDTEALKRAAFLVDNSLEFGGSDPDVIGVCAEFRIRCRQLAPGEQLAATLPAGHWRKSYVAATVLLLRTEPKPAIEKMREACAAAPPLRKASLANKVGLLLHGMRRFDEAIAMFDQALAANPTYAWAWHNRALTLYEMGDLGEAVKSSDAALAIGEFPAARDLNATLHQRAAKP